MRDSPWQSSVDELPDRLWDVVIVGAGPAGSTAATHLARSGHAVLILDRDHFPREKVCGDILIPDALNALERMGLLAEARRLGRTIETASIFSPSRIEVTIPGRYVTLQRIHLDALIAREAVDAGAVMCHGRVDRVWTVGERVACRCSSGTVIRAQVGLIATGADVRLLDGIRESRGGRASAIAARFYVRSPLPIDRLIFSYDRSTVPGYAWIAPLADGIFNVGCGVSSDPIRSGQVNLRSMLNEFTRSFPLASELLSKGKVVSPLRGAMLRCGLSQDGRGDSETVLGIGEAIDTTFPFTGEGIGKAMETAELAADAVDAALRAGDTRTLRRFPASLERALRSKYLAYNEAERWLSRPWLNDLVMRRVRRSRYLQQALAGIVEETVDPRTIFSLRGVLKSLWY